MKLTILGSTGSIGTQSLCVAKHLGYEVYAIALGKNIKKAEEQIREYKPRICAVFDENAGKLLSIAVADTDTKVIKGEDAVCHIAASECDAVINAVVGMAGLRPTLAAINGKSRLCLANKESLVCDGYEVMRKIKESGTELLPVDSEHSAIFRCLNGYKKYKKIILTASGGPFFGKKAKELEDVTIDRVLSHPTWQMGAKITVDSATLMNKGFEVLEACYLYGCEPKQIDVTVHRESIVHSMVEFEDNSVLAQLSLPDMRECIQYALTYPDICQSQLEELNLPLISSLSFYNYDRETFPLLDFAREMYYRGGSYMSAMNGANEEAVVLFLAGKIRFGDLPLAVMSASEKAGYSGNPDTDAIIQAGLEARRYVRESFLIKK